MAETHKAGSFFLEDTVPWGRSLPEYRSMFDRTDQDMRKTILGCGDGPASFNAEASAAGYRVWSTDPIFRFSVADIQSRIDEAAGVISQQLRDSAHEFVWDHFANPQELIDARLAFMRMFPLLELGSVRSRHPDAVLESLNERGYATATVAVGYEMRMGGNEMLRVVPPWSSEAGAARNASN